MRGGQKKVKIRSILFFIIRQLYKINKISILFRTYDPIFFLMYIFNLYVTLKFIHTLKNITYEKKCNKQ
jgi:hypothetical protein